MNISNMFCIDGFWNEILSINKSYALFTNCFQFSLILIASLFFLSMMILLLLTKYLYENQTKIKDVYFPDFHRNVEFILPIFSAIFSIIDMMNEFCYSEPKDPLLFVSFIIFAISLIISAFCIKIRHGGKSPIDYVMFAFWWLSNGAYVIRFYGNISKLFKGSNMLEIFILVNSVFLMCTLLLSLIFNSFQTFTNDSDQFETPEEKSSILSEITHSWMDKYIYKWFKEEMTNETTFELASEYESEINTENVEEIFFRICPGIRKQNSEKSLSKDSSNDHHPSNSGMILFKSLFKQYCHLFIILNVLRLLRDVLYLTLPLILKYLLEYFNKKEKYDTWKGIVLALVFLVQVLIAAIFENYSDMIGSKIVMRLRAALLGMIYKKILKLSIESRREHDDGHIANMCSVDTEQITLWISCSWCILSCPFQLILVTGLLYLQIDFAIFAQIIFIVLCVVFVIFVGRSIGIFIKKEFRWKDERMNLLTEILKGIKIIKMYTWEDIFYSKSLSLRKEEMKNMALVLTGMSIITVLFCSLINIVMYLNVVSYVYLVPMATLKVEKIFIIFSHCLYLKLLIMMFPSELSQRMKAFASLGRIEKFLLSSEIDSKTLCSLKDKIAGTSQMAIDIHNGHFGWNENDECILKNINLAVEKGRLVAVVGKVGVGKSILLSAILDETYSLGGTIKTQGSFALVSQEAWIQNMSLRNNILFTKEYNESFYNTVTKACCLDHDINLLPMKDESEIGEGGINLSGGQKQRISLARAIYQDSDIYLLDDPLSAVDVKVGEQLFNNVIGKEGLLKHKTRILVTHGIKWLPFMDEIIFINSEGKISGKGTFEYLMNVTDEFQHFMKESSLKVEKELRNNEENNNFDLKSEDQIFEKPFQSVKDNDDEIMVGNLNWSNLFWYVKHIGFGLFITANILCFAFCFLDCFGSLWLSRLSKYERLKNTTNNKDVYKFYINIYGLIVLTQVILSVLYIAGFVYGGLRTSKKMFEVLLTNIIYATLSFFDFTPSGRILNRFGKDLYIIDHQLITSLLIFPRFNFIIMILFVINMITMPWSVLFCIPIIIIMVIFQHIYSSTSRQSKRLDLKANSFILTNVVETYKGSSIIKSFKAEEDFQNKQYSYIDNDNKFVFINHRSNQWLTLRIDLLCNLFAFSSIILAVINRHNLDEGLACLSVTNTLRILLAMNYLLKSYSEFEVNSVSIERIRQYTEIFTESERDNKKQFHQDFIPKGNILFEQFSLKYRAKNPLVLSDISLNILEGEKVGIVGRTGVGKSTLVLALLRLIEGCDGDIYIDGINIKSIGLTELRKQITILPQDPVIFSGTLRYNLDPFDQYSTEQIIQSLEISGLLEWVNSLKENIDYNCESMGKNLSVGQKQLLCLARTILKKTKIIIIDEATAFVDEETGQKVMNAVKNQFIDSTVIIIAHRINTIINCDKILVLDKGQVLEYGSPKELMSNDNGFFKSMVMCMSEFNNNKH